VVSPAPSFEPIQAVLQDAVDAGRVPGVVAVLATGEYGEVFPTLVGQANVVGAQFHPEKSQRAGIELLDAFARWSP